MICDAHFFPVHPAAATTTLSRWSSRTLRMHMQRWSPLSRSRRPVRWCPFWQTWRPAPRSSSTSSPRAIWPASWTTTRIRCWFRRTTPSSAGIPSTGDSIRFPCRNSLSRCLETISCPCSDPCGWPMFGTWTRSSWPPWVARMSSSTANVSGSHK